MVGFMKQCSAAPCGSSESISEDWCFRMLSMFLVPFDYETSTIVLMAILTVSFRLVSELDKAIFFWRVEGAEGKTTSQDARRSLDMHRICTHTHNIWSWIEI